MTLLRLDCFEALESLTIKGPVKWLLSVLQNGVVDDYMNEGKAPAVFWKTLRRVELMSLSWSSLWERNVSRLVGVLRMMPRLEYLYLDHAMEIIDGIVVEKDEENEVEERCLQLRELRILFDCDPRITPASIQSVILDQFAPNLELLTLATLEEDTKVGETMQEWSKTMNERRRQGRRSERGGDDGVVVMVVEHDSCAEIGRAHV